MTAPITFVINGQTVELAARPGTTLLSALREDLDLKATRYGCGAEACGACTVVVDGQPQYACTLPVADVAGCRIETAEGLDATDPPHPLVAAFIAHQAGQCGYCLPGILMRASALLDRGEAVDRAQVAQELNANLCRCGAHNRILDAIMDAAREMGVAR